MPNDFDSAPCNGDCADGPGYCNAPNCRVFTQRSTKPNLATMEKNQSVGLSEEEKDRLQAIHVLLQAIRGVEIDTRRPQRADRDLYWFLLGHTEGVIERMIEGGSPNEGMSWLEYVAYKLEKVYKAFGYATTT